jgi:hypothetical protein
VEEFCKYCGRNEQGLMPLNEALREIRHENEVRDLHQKLEEERRLNTQKWWFALGFVGLIVLFWLLIKYFGGGTLGGGPEP